METDSDASAGSGALRLLAWVLTAACFAAALFVVASTFSAAYEGLVPGFYKDLWTFVPILQKLESGGTSWSDWTRPHASGHRLLFPRLLYAVEHRVFDGSNVFLVCSSFALQGLAVGGLARSLWKDFPNDAAMRWFLLGLGGILAYSATLLFDVLHPWNVSWFLCNLGIVGAFLALAPIRDAAERGAELRAWLSWSAGVGFAGVAAYSMGHGMTVWVLWPVAAWLARVPARFSLAFLAIGAGVGSVYFSHLAPGHPVFLGPRAFVWLMSLLAVPLPGDAAGMGRWWAVLGVATAIALVVRVARRRQQASAGETALAGVVMVAGASATMIAAARSVPMPAGWGAERYQPIVLLFWLGTLWLALLALRGPGRLREVARIGAMLGILLWVGSVFVPAHLEARAVALDRSRNLRIGNLALLNQVDAQREYQSILSASDLKRGLGLVPRYRGFLVEEGLGVFAPGHHEWIGQRIDALFSEVSSDRCQGEVLRSRHVPGDTGVRRITGWAWDVGEVAPPVLVLFANRGGRILGLGAALEPRTSPFRRQRSPRHAEFVGYLRAFHGVLETWALLGSGEVCPLTIRKAPGPGGGAAPRPGV